MKKEIRRSSRKTSARRKRTPRVAPRARTSPRVRAARRLKTLSIEEMAWPDVRDALKRGFTTVVIGVGSTEQHGPHLPTMTDTRISDEVARRVASRLGRALHGRTISVGCSEHHLAFPGTISIKPETLRRVLLDYTDSLVRGGFRRIIFLPFHGGNFRTVEDAVRTARVAHPGIKVVGITDLKRMFGCLSEASGEFGVTPGESGGHSGESETSIMMFLEKNLVVRKRFAPGFVGQMDDRQRRIVQEMMHERGMRAVTRNGVIGDPTKASARKGGVYLDRLTDFVLREIEDQS